MHVMFAAPATCKPMCMFAATWAANLPVFGARDYSVHVTGDTVTWAELFGYP